jgi:homogentisate phytyltransferase/homogentisate geranylgeranyltransferase
MNEINVLSSNKPQILNKTIRLGSFWEFSRPHTILGTIVTVLTLFFITISDVFSITKQDFVILVMTLISSLLANIFIVGLNQIYDIEIDKINKPYLPLASDELSIKQAKIIVSLSLILCIFFAALVNIYLIITVILGVSIGSLYSMPKTRFKTKPFLASFSISFVRGVLGNIGLYFSYKSSLAITKSNIEIVIIFLTIFVLINAYVIAIFKDIPDIEGDKKYNVITFSVRLGQKKIFSISIWLLLANYAFAIIAGLFIQSIWNQFFVIVLHLIVGIIFYFESRKTIPQDKISIWRFYKKIWRFFYLEYVILAFVVIF